MNAKPSFTGYPQALLTRLTPQESNIQLWQWAPLTGRLIKNLDAINMLVGQGYQPISQEDGQTYLGCLMTQCYDVSVLEMPDQEKAEAWARPDDLQRVEKCPVILAFQPDVAQSPEQEAIPMLQYLPPPTMGEYALIREGNRSIFYNIGQLPGDKLALWEQLEVELGSLQKSPTECVRF
jgi:hypothetical protein